MAVSSTDDFGSLMNALKQKDSQKALEILVGVYITPNFILGCCPEDLKVNREAAETIVEFLSKKDFSISDLNHRAGTLEQQTTVSSSPYGPPPPDFMCSCENVTPLQLAQQKKCQEAVKFLLDMDGVDINVFNRGGNTPFHVACMEGNIEIIKKYISIGADINIKTRTGFTGLHLAVNKKQREVVEFLLSQPNICLDKKKTANSLLCLGVKSSQEILDLLLEKVDVNEQNLNGNTALMEAARMCNIPLIHKLKKFNPNPNIQDNYGKTALMFAATAKYVELIDMIMEMGKYDINTQDCKGNTALHYAARKLNVDIVALLSSVEGVDSSIQNNKGNTALDLGSSNNEVRQLLQGIENAI